MNITHPERQSALPVAETVVKVGEEIPLSRAWGRRIGTVCGIYAIVCRVNGKRYIGSSIDVSRRIKHHRCGLRGKRHYNTHLQRAYDLYGEEAFKVCVIEVCSMDILPDRERFNVAAYKSLENGFNMLPDTVTRRGYKYDDAAKAKMSLIAKATFGTPEVSAQRVEIWKEPGRKEAASIRMKQLWMKDGYSSNLRKKRANQYSDAAKREAMSELLKGRIITKEHQEKINAARKRHPERHAHPYALLSPTGDVFVGLGVTEFAGKHGLDGGAMRKVCSGKIPHHKQWRMALPLS